MSKLSFRARALDASKPMPILMAEELPDLPDYSAINRAVPQMPSGMEKEEECEHHLQRAICAGLIIPTPEVTDIPNKEFYDKVYPANYKQPRQLIHMQPFALEQDIPDYDMDSEDEVWLQSQTQRLELSPLKFEEMMDRLEKSSGQTVVTLNEAKALLKEDDDLIIAVFDYWLNKRLKTQHPLILSVKTEHRTGTAPNNPYIAFRRRTEKMQTRKNRKNDESSYEKMLKLRRDLYRAVSLLEFVKRREKLKREFVHLTVEVFEKQYQAKDFSGAISAEASAVKASSRPAFTQIFHNHYTNQSWANKAILKDEVIPRKEKRQYKKRKHKSLGHSRSGMSGMDGLGFLSSDEEPVQLSPETEDVEDEGQFAFRRNKSCSYHMPVSKLGNWPWCSKEENGVADERFRFTLTSLSNPRRCIGFARRRVGRGGRIILDRVSTDYDDFWRTLDYSITEPDNKKKMQTFSETTSEMLCSDSYSNFIVNNKKNNKLQLTDFKSEFSHYDNNSGLRTSVSELGSESESAVKLEIKQEPDEVPEEDSVPVTPVYTQEVQTKEERDEMLELLQSIRKNWLHYRPKTPPEDYEPPCDMLPPDDNIFNPCANVPFKLEIEPLDSNILLDTSTFTTESFTFDNLDTLDVPVTDTRQPSDNNVQTGINLNVNVGLNTLTSSVIDSSSSNVNLNDSLDVCETSDGDVTAIALEPTDDLYHDRDGRTIGCSMFNLLDTPDLNCSQIQCNKSHTDNRNIKHKNFNNVSHKKTDNSLANTNGLLTPFGIDGSIGRKKNNKFSYAYTGGVGYSNTSSSSLSLHTTAHPLTLNSHSANILEIPIANEAETVANKLVNSQCTEPSGTGPNNKNKNIVQKNNLVMEVT